MDLYVSNVKENISGQGIVTVIESGLESEDEYIKAYEESSREDAMSDSVFTADTPRKDKNVRFSFISEVLDRDSKRRIVNAPVRSVDCFVISMTNLTIGKRKRNHRGDVRAATRASAPGRR